MALLRCLIAVLLLALPARAEVKVAMVIGNATYAHASTLANPINDARAVAAKLQGIGFDVSLHEDLDGQAFRVALGAFSEKALHADLAVVFYAGHAIEMAGQNYLIPIDAEMRSESTAKFETVTLEQVLGSVREAGKLGMVMLDACRNNPFATSMQRSNGTRAVSRGLAAVSVEGETGLLVSFAAEAGNTADDGDTGHSPYTAALLEVLDKPGLEVGRMFRTVRARVKETTGGKQVPIEQMQLPDQDIFLVSAPAASDPPATDPTPMVGVLTMPPDPTVIYFDAVKAGTVQALADFISRYPAHEKAADARALMASMEDDAFWQTTTAANTAAAYRRYILVFPDGIYLAEAEQQLAALTPAPEAPAPPAPVQPQATQQFVAPTFDCGKATTDAEIAICTSAELAQQDHRMVALYKNAVAQGWTTKSQQRDFVAYRDAACVGAEAIQCVLRVTNERIVALGG